MPLPYQTNYGLIRRGSVDSYNSSTNKISLIIDSAQSSFTSGFKQQTQVNMPYVLAYNNGLMIGANPVRGTPMSVVQGEGNEGFFVSCLPQGNTLNKFPTIKDNELVISSTLKSYIKLNTSYEINIGSDTDYIKIKTPDKQIDTFISSTIDNEYTNRQSKLEITGLVRREYAENFNYVDFSKLTNDDFLNSMILVGMDSTPAISINNNNQKNPPFVETRELIYELAIDSNIESNILEENNYTSSPVHTKKQNKHNDRRNSRANTFNLNLYNPNSLIEEIKGTGIDIFGNIIDINRSKISLSNLSSSQDNKDNFLSIKADERKSIAYHFEINARKDELNISNYSSSDNFGRARSNFILDVDKEGLFKLNIPASSEKGNVPLLTRYINASALTDSPNDLIFTDDKIDIQQDSFSIDSINIVQGTNTNTPVDRITTQHIKYGTAYHNITNTCNTIQTTDYYSYIRDSSLTNCPVVINTTKQNKILSGFYPMKDIISDTIMYGTNSGGRSGSINFDGSIDLNVGANTVDKQSIVFDSEGGITGNIGKDKRDISTSISMDGALVLKVGGTNTTKDTRFIDRPVGGIVDIEVLSSGGNTSIIRIDDTGTYIITPGRITMHASQDVNITSDASIRILAENLYLQNRLVNKLKGSSI